MKCKVDIILDSVNPNGDRLVTMLLTYPRFVLAELNTHRVFSRNSASSRAKPSKKVRQMIKDYPVVPVYWGKNQRGMSASVEISPFKQRLAKGIWLGLRHISLASAYLLERLEVHKQITNRVLEPWMFTQTLVTATDWVNFLHLRDSPHAQPEIAELARLIRVALIESSPVKLDYGEWHIPFIREYEQDLTLHTKQKVSVARCARTSYYLFDGNISDVESDINRHDRLLEDHHWSPFEHQAFVPAPIEGDYKPSNFKGWTQYRKTLGHIENWDGWKSLEELLSEEYTD